MADNVKKGVMRDAASLLILCALTLIFFRNALVTRGEVILGSPFLVDLTHQFYPWRTLGFGLLREGRIPLWNPYLFCGYPFVANWQSAIFYPPNLIFLLLPVHTAINWSFAFHVFLAGAFTYAFMRYVVDLRIAAFLSALTFMFSSALILRVFAGHLSMVCAIPWLPLGLLMVELGLRRRRACCFACAGAALAAQLLAGHIQCAFYSAVALCLYLCMRRVSLSMSRGKGALTLRCIGAVLIIATVAAALAAVQLLPGIEFILNSERRTMTYEEAAGASFPPRNMITSLIPDFFGDFLSTPYRGISFLWEVSIYIGILPLVLAVIAVLLRRDAFTVIFALLAALFFILAMGAYTPVFKFLYNYIPGFNMMRGSAKAIYITGYALSFLAGLGCERIFRGGLSRAARISVMISLLILSAVFALYHLPVKAQDLRGLMAGLPRGAMTGFLRTSLFLAASALWIALAAKRHAGRGVTVVLMASICLLDLWNFGCKYMITSDADCCRWPRDMVSFFKRDEGAYRILRDIRVPVPGVNQNMNDGICSFDGYEPIAAANFYEFSRVLGVGPERASELVSRGGLLYPLSLANIKYLITPPYVRNFRSAFIPRFYNGFAMVFENTKVLPRAFVAHGARVVSDPAKVLDYMKDGSFRPAEQIILHDAPGMPLPEYQSALPGEGAEIIGNPDPNTVNVRCRLEEPGLLFMSDTHYPGWRVTVDGFPGIILKANCAFRAVPLEAGEHKVSFIYDPVSFRLGVFLSFISILAMAVYFIAGLDSVSGRNMF